MLRHHQYPSQGYFEVLAGRVTLPSSAGSEVLPEFGRCLADPWLLSPLRLAAGRPDEDPDEGRMPELGVRPGTSARTRDKKGHATWTSKNTPIGPRASCSRRRALALREGHQRFLPEHLLKVLLDDPEGMAANLIQAAGGNAKAAQAAATQLLTQAAQGRGRRRRPALHGARDRAAVRPGRAGGEEGRRLLRHRRAAAAGAGDERHGARPRR